MNLANNPYYRKAVAERQDFQKFLKIQVIPGINPKFNLLSLVSLLEHFPPPPPFKEKKKKENREINQSTPVAPALLSLPRRAELCPDLAARHTARGSQAIVCFPVS